MRSRCCEFVDSRLRRSPPDRASAVPYGQAGENAMRFPHLAHRSAADHKLHSTRQQHEMKLISGNGETSSRLPAFSLFLPGTCPNNRDRRSARTSHVRALPPIMYGTAWKEDRTQALVLEAIATGFRAFDTANQRKHYVEEEVGAAVRTEIVTGTVTREDLSLSS